MEKNYTIMFVDDEQNLLMAMKRIFKRSTYKVFLAGSAREALEIMESESVDILVTDQRMPVMTGIELCRRVKDLYPHTIRIILTAYSDMADMITAIDQGEVYGMLRKPINLDQFQKFVERAMDQSRVIDSFQQIVERFNQQGQDYKMQVDYTSGRISIGFGGNSRSLTRDKVACLLKCMSDVKDGDESLALVSTVLARHNGRMSINAEFGSGIRLSVGFDIEDEASVNGR